MYKNPSCNRSVWISFWKASWTLVSLFLLPAWGSWFLGVHFSILRYLKWGLVIGISLECPQPSSMAISGRIAKNLWKGWSATSNMIAYNCVVLEVTSGTPCFHLHSELHLRNARITRPNLKLLTDFLFISHLQWYP